MERALAVVRETDRTEEMIREAGELAAGVDAELVLLHVTDEESFTERSTAVAGVPDYDGGYSVDNATDAAREYALDVGRRALEGVGAEFEAVGAIGDQTDEVLEIAAERDCDHVFLTGQKRSPAGKALFGDTAQSVILNFEGAVTILTE